jgi:hypothetical protein
LGGRWDPADSLRGAQSLGKAIAPAESSRSHLNSDRAVNSADATLVRPLPGMGRTTSLAKPDNSVMKHKFLPLLIGATALFAQSISADTLYDRSNILTGTGTGNGFNRANTSL